MKTFKLLATGLVSILCTATLAFAQEEQVGATSYSETSMTLTTTDYIQIKNLADPILNNGAYVPGSGVAEEDDVVVYTNQADQHYTVTATCTKGGAAGATEPCTADANFFLASIDQGNNDNEIPYTVIFDGDTTCLGAAALAYNTASAQFTGTDVYPPLVDNACLRITITDANIMAVAPDTYKGVLRITASPDNS